MKLSNNNKKWIIKGAQPLLLKFPKFFDVALYFTSLSSFSLLLLDEGKPMVI